jgi:hypothetical protein
VSAPSEPAHACGLHMWCTCGSGRQSPARGSPSAWCGSEGGAQGCDGWAGAFCWQSAPKPKTKVKAIDGATFTMGQIDAMDKSSLQTMLQKYGLPTSGRIDKLKERLAEVAVVDK